jgi:predicted anti-sigma-YlaC factor YlaD
MMPKMPITRHSSFNVNRSGGLFQLKLWPQGRAPAVLLVILSSLFWQGCSVRRYAINTLADALSQSGKTFSSDDDPELVRGALPFSLKLVESLLAESPKHEGLLLAACQGFTQYSYAFIQQDADEIEGKDLSAANVLRARARRLYLRARNYGLRGLDLKYVNFEKRLRSDPKTAAEKVGVSDVPLLYWTASSWGAAIALSKDDPELIADLPFVEALIDRAFQLKEDFDHGAIHTFLITFEGSRQGVKGDATVRSRTHFQRAMELSSGKLASPLVSFVEAVSIGRQDKAEFQSLLGQALKVDANANPEWLLQNLVMQRRARWLLSRMDELFVD